MKPKESPPLFVGEFITPEMTRHEARLWAIHNGFRFLGGGSFAGCALDPKSGRVLRVGRPDAGAEATFQLYANEAKDNPHATRIYGIVTLANGGTAVEMEFLTAPDGAAVRELRRGKRKPTPNTEDGKVLRDQLDAARNASEFPIDWDLHGNNVLARDGVLVWADPLYDSGSWGDDREQLESCNAHGDISWDAVEKEVNANA